MKKIIFLIIVAIIVVMGTKDNEYLEIPSTSIRIRVIGNSNSDKDQKEKIIIKSAVENILYKVIGSDDDYTSIDKKISQNLDLIDNSISNTMKENNINYKFTTNYGYNYFPEKSYKGIKYPSGNYKSYVVTLGEGNGENWWCVLYPPICLVDENVSEYEYRSIIKDTILKYN